MIFFELKPKGKKFSKIITMTIDIGLEIRPCIAAITLRERGFSGLMPILFETFAIIGSIA